MRRFSFLLFVLSCSCAEQKEDFSFSVSTGSGQTEDRDNESIDTESSSTEDSTDTGIDETNNSAEEEPCFISAESRMISPDQLTGRVECGEEVYMRQCASCHGAQGEGTENGQVLQGHIQGHGNFDLIQSIVYGEGTMPPQNLENQEVADVIAYMRTNF